MKKNGRAKLKLSTESLRNLSTREAARVGGGMMIEWPPTNPIDCYSVLAQWCESFGLRC